MKIKKDRLLTLLQFLMYETDEEHSVTVANIMTYLERVGFSATRKTIYADISTLQLHGIDVVCNKSRENQYFIGSRDLELAELTLLVDAIQSAKFISVKRSKEIIKKLSSLTSIHNADKLNRRLYVDKQIKSSNDKVLYTLDILHNAINDNVQVEFQYYEYNTDKKKTFKHNGKIYRFSPYALLWSNDCYYTLGYSESHEKVATFRIDRIINTKSSKEKRVPKPKGFRAEEHVKSVFQMFGGEVHTITLQCENALMDSVIDRFGEKVKTAVIDNEHFTAEVDVSASPTFFGWVVSFSGRMKIIAPTDVKQMYINLLNQILKTLHQ